MKKLTYCIAVVVLFISFSCSPGKKPQDEAKAIEKSSIAVVNYPLYFFATEIGGDKVEVFFPEMDGDPAYWNPDPQSIRIFQEADLIFLNGADYSKWIEKVSLPASTQINTSESFTDKLIELRGEAHSHGPEGEHSHTGYAFTTWLDFKLAAEQAESVRKAMVKLLPEHETIFNENAEKLMAELNQLDTSLSALLESNGNPEFFASHPVYQYFSKGYGVTVISYHWEPGQMPDESEWITFKKAKADHSASIMLWEDEPAPEIRIRLEEMGITVVVFNPGGNRNELDFISLMKGNIERLAMAF